MHTVDELLHERRLPHRERDPDVQCKPVRATPDLRERLQALQWHLHSKLAMLHRSGLPGEPRARFVRVLGRVLPRLVLARDAKLRRTVYRCERMLLERGLLGAGERDGRFLRQRHLSVQLRCRVPGLQRSMRFHRSVLRKRRSAMTAHRPRGVIVTVALA